MKADVQGFPKMWYFSKIGDFKPELWLLKVGSNLKIFLEFVLKKSWRYKKKTRPQFFRFRFPIESAGTKVGYFDADSIWSRNFENCGRVFFFEHLIISWTNSLLPRSPDFELQ